MAARFWVGGTGTWDASSTTHWSATSGGASGASVPTSADDVTFDANSGTAATVTVNGGGVANTITINKSDLTLTHTTESTVTGTVTHTTGTLNTNGQTCVWGAFSSTNSNTRTLTFGASPITITGGGGAWSVTTTAGLTVTANTAVVTFTGSNAVFNVSGGNWNGLSLVFTGGGNATLASVGSGPSGLKNVTRTGTAATTDGLTVRANMTISGTLTTTGNSVTNRLLVQTDAVGTARTITAAAVSITNCDFMDVTGAGAAAPFTGTSVGDCGGNSGITFNASVQQTWSGTTGGNWSTNAWTTRVPLPQDDVVVSSAFVASQTITADMPRLGRSVTFSCTGSPILSRTTASTVFGSLTLASGMTTSGSVSTTMAGRSSYTLDLKGISWSGGSSFIIAAPGGSYTLLSALLLVTGITISNGTFDASSSNVTCLSLSSAGTATRTIKLGSGTWTLTTTGTNNVWNTSTTTGLTFDAGTSTIVISATDSGVNRSFLGGGLTFNTLRYSSTGNAALTIAGNNTFAGNLDLECTTARTVAFPAGGTQTVLGALTLMGAAGQPLNLVSSTPGTATTIVAPWEATTRSNWTRSADVLFTILESATISIVGASSVSSSVVRDRALTVAAITGASSVTASLGRVRTIVVAAIAGASSVSAALGRVRSLIVAAIVGSSTATATVTNVYGPRADISLGKPLSGWSCGKPR